MNVASFYEYKLFNVETTFCILLPQPH